MIGYLETVMTAVHLKKISVGDLRRQLENFGEETLLLVCIMVTDEDQKFSTGTCCTISEIKG